MFLDNTNPLFEHAEPSYTQKSLCSDAKTRMRKEK